MPSPLRLTALAALSPTALQKLLLAADPRIDSDAIRLHIEAGMPTNKDGSINFVEYAAWLVKKASSNGD